MRLTDLLGLEVVDTEGRHLGKVNDALLVQDGPLTFGTDASFRLHAVAVGRGSIGARLGYSQGVVERPRLLKRLFGRSLLLIPWTEILERDEHRITVRTPADQSSGRPPTGPTE
jgi:hypothetical protein